jgi:Putative  PD-(D/E)XK family member, (DUF4420)
MPDQTQRHVSAQGFADYLAANVPVVLPLAGEPAVTIFIDPTKMRIGLRSPIATDSPVPPSPLANLQLSTVHVDGARQIEIASSEPELFNDVYPMLCAVADRVQIEHEAPLVALEQTLEIWGRLLAQRTRLSRDNEIGLVGELLFLRGLAKAWTPAEAVSSWRGPAAEEHDFGLTELDLEIKTTTGERRKHWISSATQLVPSPGRALWLVSIQITGAGAGGESLAGLVDSVASLITDDVAQVRFRGVLKSLHWSDDQRDLYVQRWQLRSKPRALSVNDAFPALTPDTLAALGLDTGHITQLRYELDITDWSSDDPRQLLMSTLAEIA